jgi:hypothetical protein
MQTRSRSFPVVANISVEPTVSSALRALASSAHAER